MLVADIHILKSSLPMHNLIRRLSSIETRWYFAMLLLALVAASRGLAFAAGRSATAADLLVVRAFGIGEGGQDGCIALLLLEKRVEERCQWLV